MGKIALRRYLETHETHFWGIMRPLERPRIAAMGLWLAMHGYET